MWNEKFTQIHFVKDEITKLSATGWIVFFHEIYVARENLMRRYIIINFSKRKNEWEKAFMNN